MLLKVSGKQNNYSVHVLGKFIYSSNQKSESSSVVPDSCEPMDDTVHGILQARISEWVAFPSSRESSQPRDQTQVSNIAGKFFTSWLERNEYFLFTLLENVYPTGFGLLCFHFHSFLCIFWFLFWFLLWFVGYSEVCCSTSICWNC